MSLKYSIILYIIIPKGLRIYFAFEHLFSNRNVFNSLLKSLNIPFSSKLVFVVLQYKYHGLCSTYLHKNFPVIHLAF